jgi:hypothetical protein
MKKNKYIVEIFQDNKWKFYSDHNNKEYAIPNAKVVHKSRKVEVRIKYKGEIILNQEAILKEK